MYVTFDTPTANAAGALNNSGSAAGFVQYMEKENQLAQEQGRNPEEWFSSERERVHPAEVRKEIDLDHQGIRKEEGKFATGSINPTAEEWQALGNTEAERLSNFKKWVQEDFTKEYAANFQKFDRSGNAIPIRTEDVKIYYKVEMERSYKGTDEAVKQGLKAQGEAKEGFNVHCHFITARKTRDGQYRIAPTTNNRKEFDRTKLKINTEKSFDLRTGYQRELKNTFDYARTMKHGTAKAKTELIKKSAAQQVAARKALEHKVKKDIAKKVTKAVARKIVTGGLSL